ncbi:GTP cyclohydrolase I FolE [Kribbella sancticallisti]|uniref:GTP cyclohydrolase 1 n=1 Tax=Kribbella sancticallisti TaxID=460087 RepID=A0ABP4PJA9_9ACTN
MTTFRSELDTADLRDLGPERELEPVRELGPVRERGAEREPAAGRSVPLHIVGGRPEINLVAARKAVADLLVALGRDPHSEHLAETPRRVADAYAEMLTPREFDLTTFPNDEGYDELVLARSIPVQSLCEHHMLPFEGVAHVGYLPGARILGLSKLARVVELFARDLQVQERLTKQVADWLQDHLAPKGVGVVIEAEHQCMSLRGVRAAGSRTVTSALKGVLRENPGSRQEFFALTGIGA